jgi:hypothetical protein
MGERALRRVHLDGGWRGFGERAMSVYREVRS